MLARGQQPNALFIACSDSRVVPNLFASTNPGDLFVVRNVGNLIPPASPTDQDNCSAAAIEFAVFSLKVSDIVVCGHSECGAMIALTENTNITSCTHLKTWLRHGNTALDRLRNGFVLDQTLTEHNQLSQVNVLQQMEHILSYPFVCDHVEQGLIRIHGWWFDIAKADVYCYEPSINQFVLIDEEEAQIILARLG